MNYETQAECVYCHTVCDRVDMIETTGGGGMCADCEAEGNE